MKKKLYGNYLGMVISGADKDPENRGRCQIYFPGISNTLYKKVNKNLKDLSFGHIDPSIFTPDILNDLRTVLPWSECAAPIAGGGTRAYYNGVTGKTALGVAETINSDAATPTVHEKPQAPAAADVENRPDDILDGDVDGTNSKESLRGVSEVELNRTDNLQGNNKTYNNSSINSIHPNVLKIMAGIGASESGFSEKEISQSWKYDPSSYFINGVKGPDNYKLDGSNFAKINSGYYQTSQDMGDKYNISSINSGTFEEQTVKTAQFIEKEYPSLYKQAISSNSNQELLSITQNMGRWFGPKDSPTKTFNAINATGDDPASYFSKLNQTKNPTYLASNGKSSTNGDSIPPIDPTQTAANPDPEDLSTPSTPANVGYSGRPHGIFSFPRMGAKLWAFFYGGDIQRPVYFAAAYEPDSIRYATGAASPSSKNKEADVTASAAYQEIDKDAADNLPTDSSVSETKWSDLQGIAGGVIESSFSVSGDSKSDSIPLNKSYLGIRNTDGSGITFQNANMWNLGSADNATHILGTEEGIKLRTTEGAIKLTADTIEINGNLVVNSGTNQKDPKKTKEYLDKEQQVVTQIANQTASDIAKGGEEQNCPVCEQKLADDKSDFVAKILKIIKKFSNILPWDCWNWGVTKFLVNSIVTPMLSEVSALAVSGGEGCGMCDKGKVKSYASSIENANKKASETFAQKQNEINESAKHFKPGSNVQTVVGSWGIDAGGDHMNNATCSKELNDDCSVIPTGLKKGEGGKANQLHLTGEKVKTVAHIPPNKTSAGEIFFKAANEIRLISGSPGMSMESNGKISITGGFLDLNSMDGPAVLTSKNVTNVNGAKVHITGAKGITLTAPSTLVNGNLSVSGNLGVKGSITLDGALSVKHLKVKTMRSETTSNSSPKSTSNGTTYYTGGCAAINIFDQVKNVLTRDNPLKMLMLTPKGLLTIFQ